MLIEENSKNEESGFIVTIYSTFHFKVSPTYVISLHHYDEVGPIVL